jgi:hypothetical protein
LVVTLGLAVWREHSISLREGHEQWQQQASEIAGTDANETAPSVYLGERSDLNEMLIRHPERGVKDVNDGV